MEIAETQKEQVIRKIQSILYGQHSGPKREMKVNRDRLNFACPYCGDSSDPYKKRGNLYWKSLQYHCYNGGCSKRHTNLIEFLKDFDQPISDKTDLMFFLDYIRVNQVVIPTKDYLELGIFENLIEHAIPLSTIKEKLNLVEPSENLRIERYLKGRFLFNKMHNFMYDPKAEQLYIFNLTPDLKRTVGWQIRNFKPGKEKYVSYNLEKINDIILNKRIELHSDELIKMNTLSIYFGLMLVNFEKPVTVFEGPIDALLCPNSISISGIDKPTEMFDDIPTIRYLFDNDRIGRVKMEQKLKKKKSVFMWAKLVRDFKIRKPIKDFNDLIEYCWKQKNESIRHYEKYFTDNPLDIRSV